MATYKNKLSPKAAADKAWKKATTSLPAWINGNKKGPLNCGDDDDYVFTDDETALSSAWKGKKLKIGDVEYSAKPVLASSGEAKFDLRLANGSGPSVFNYHVPFKKDTSADEARAATSAADKKAAALKKAELEEKKKQLEASAKAAAALKKETDKLNAKLTQAARTKWNSLPAAQQKKFPADKFVAAYLAEHKK